MAKVARNYIKVYRQSDQQLTKNMFNKYQTLSELFARLSSYHITFVYLNKFILLFQYIRNYLFICDNNPLKTDHSKLKKRIKSYNSFK